MAGPALLAGLTLLVALLLGQPHLARAQWVAGITANLTANLPNFTWGTRMMSFNPSGAQYIAANGQPEITSVVIDTTTYPALNSSWATQYTVPGGQLFADNYGGRWFFEKNVNLTLDHLETDAIRQQHIEYWMDLMSPATGGLIQGAYESATPGNKTAAQLSALAAVYCPAPLNKTYSFQYNSSYGLGAYYFWSIRPPQYTWQVNYFVPNMYPNQSAALQAMGGFSPGGLTSGWTNASYMPSKFNFTDIGLQYVMAGPSWDGLAYNFLVPKALVTNTTFNASGGLNANTIGMTVQAWQACFSCSRPGTCTNVSGGNSWDQFAAWRSLTTSYPLASALLPEQLISPASQTQAYSNCTLRDFSATGSNPPVPAAIYSILCSFPAIQLSSHIYLNPQVQILDGILPQAIGQLTYNGMAVPFQVNTPTAVMNFTLANVGNLPGTFSLVSSWCCYQYANGAVACSSYNITAAATANITIPVNGSAYIPMVVTAPLTLGNFALGSCDVGIQMGSVAPTTFTTAIFARMPPPPPPPPPPAPWPPSYIPYVSFYTRFATLSLAQLNNTDFAGVFTGCYVFVIASLALVGDNQVDVTSIFNASGSAAGVVFATTVVYPPKQQYMAVAGAFETKLLAQGNVVLNANLYLEQWGNITVTNVMSGYLPSAPPPTVPAPAPAPSPASQCAASNQTLSCGANGRAVPLGTGQRCVCECEMGWATTLLPNGTLLYCSLPFGANATAPAAPGAWSILDLSFTIDGLLALLGAVMAPLLVLCLSWNLLAKSRQAADLKANLAAIADT